jgi:hypothetical protein
MQVAYPILRGSKCPFLTCRILIVQCPFRRMTCGALIEPMHYECYLKNAVVCLHFMMSHWAIAVKKGREAACDMFGADLHAICVLVAPTQRIQLAHTNERFLVRTQWVQEDLQQKKLTPISK